MSKPAKPFLAYSPWDIFPVIAGILHFAFVIGGILLFPRLPLWGAVLFGLIYAVSIAWNVNSISHNLIHNPFFSWRPLNWAFSLLISLTLGFSQTMYHWVHMRHHSGNGDRQDANGKTVDPISIYLHGKNGQPEGALAYSFLSYFRDDPGPIYRALKSKRPAVARWGVIELVSVAVLYGGLALWDWKAILFYVPFYYLGHSLSAMNGYYEHLHSNPEVPITWGVSCYNRLYNWTWMNNGYHAEHHYRPKQHWTKMRELRDRILPEQQAAGLHVIKWPHVVGFLDRSPAPDFRRG